MIVCSSSEPAPKMKMAWAVKWPKLAKYRLSNSVDIYSKPVAYTTSFGELGTTRELDYRSSNSSSVAQVARWPETTNRPLSSWPTYNSRLSLHLTTACLPPPCCCCCCDSTQYLYSRGPGLTTQSHVHMVDLVWLLNWLGNDLTDCGSS